LIAVVVIVAASVSKQNMYKKRCSPSEEDDIRSNR